MERGISRTPKRLQLSNAHLESFGEARVLSNIPQRCQTSVPLSEDHGKSIASIRFYYRSRVTN